MDCLSFPRIFDGAITRQHLLTVLEPEKISRIRLLCTPAGFGKTVLARQFSELENITEVVWVSLPINQPLKPSLIIIHICTALGLSTTDDETLRQALDTSSNTLVILDGYQPQSESDAWLLAYIQQTNIQWLITTRRKPEWPLSRLLLDGQLIALDSENLTLTVSEVTSILELIAPEQNFCARTLHEQTNGWIAGLRLFLHAQIGRESLMQINLHRSPYLLDYLDQEILASISSSERRLLNVIAHAPFVDSTLCAVLSGETFSLQELLAKQTFLRRLPGSTDQFTIYEPLRSVLRERYPDQKALLVTALTWLEETGRHLNAFSYAICTLSISRAVLALAQVPLYKLFAENNLSLILWGLNHLRLDDFIDQPKALIIATRALIMGGKLELAECYLSAFPKQGWSGTQLALQAELALHRGQAQEACKLSVRALVELNQNEDWVQMILCFSCISRAELALGQYEQARRQQMQGFELARLKGQMLLECQLLLDQAQVEEMAGNLNRALEVLDKVRVLIGRSGGSALLSGAEQIRRGWLLMLIGDDVGARLPLEHGQELSMASGTPIFFYSYILLAQLDARNGNTEYAQQRLSEVQRVMYTRGISESIYRSVLSVGSASIELLAHQYQPVMHLLERMWHKYSESNSLTPPSACPELFALMSFLHAQVLCSQGALDKAIDVLTQVLEKAEGFGFQVIVSQALMALGKARHQRGDICQAERILASAAAMAVRQGQGQLIPEVQCNSAIEFNQNIENRISSTPLIESVETLLSPREHMVLELIAKGYSNAEIAEILSISLHTVKAHAKRINVKFQVNRRTSAVARAKILGLLV